MADEKLNYTLTLATRSTGTGAKDTAAELDRVARAKEKVDTVSRYNGLDDFMRKTETSTRAAFGELYILGAELDQVNKKASSAAAQTETFSTGATKVGKSSGNASQSLLLFSQGFEDAQYGIRGVLNNIPSLIMSLGGTAGLAGAISIAAVSLSVLGEWFGKTGKNASKLAERIDDVASSAAETHADRIEEASDALRIAADEAEKLRQNFDETKKANNDYANAALTNAEKLTAAENNINVALGLRVDQMKELVAMAAAEQAQRELAAQQAIQAEQNKIDKANQEIETKAKIYKDTVDLALVNRQDYEVTKQKLDVLRAQKAELEKLVTAKTKANNDPFRDPAEAAKDYQTVRDSKKKLALPEFQAEIKALEARMDDLVNKVRENTKAVRASAVNVEAAENAFRDISQGAATNIDRLQETLTADTTVAKTGEVVEKQKLLATQLTEALGQMEPATAATVAAKDSLLKAASDGILTAQEIAMHAGDLVTLTGGIQTGMVSVNGNMQSLIQTMLQFQADQTAIKAEVSRLSRQLGNGSATSLSPAPAR